MATRAKELSDLGNLKLDVTATGIDVVGEVQASGNITAGGNIGIKQSNPAALLHIGDSTNSLGETAGDEINVLRLQSDTANTDSLMFTTERLSDGTTWQTAAHRIQRKVDTSLMGYLQFGNNQSDLITFGKGDNEYVRIDGASGGNVGIGTDSPGYRLTVQKDVDSFVMKVENDGNSPGTSGASYADASDGLWVDTRWNTATNTPFKVTSNSGTSPMMIVKGDGKVGMGTTDPDEVLTLNSSSNTRLLLQESGNDKGHIGAGGGGLYIKNLAGDVIFRNSSDADTVRIKNDGKVGIGTIDPSENLEVAGTALVENAKLKAIAKDISTTPVDAFIYDTRKDSDGGAWRHRTQNTSWYNETLNTATRGSRKEFPAVAVITLNSGEIIIYDGDDPDVPMWMKFTQSTGQSFTENGQSSYVVGGCGFATTSGITMLNGTLVVPHHGGCGSGDTREGILSLNFLSEVGEWITDSSAANFNFAGPISNRNTNMRLLLKQSTRTILDSEVNDVAMTVLPNAPIDSATGLPIPTIGVASEEGVSVIKDDGTIVDITHTASVHKGAKHISFNGSQVSYATQQSGSGTTFWRKVYINIPDSDITAAYASSIANNTSYDARGTTGNKPALNGDNDLGDITNDIVDSIHDKAFAFSNKLTLLHVEQFSKGNLPIDSSVAYIASNYNTGWMNGDVKIATLSDTNATNLSGTNRCAADDFSSGWTVTSGSNMSIGSNVLSVVDTSNVGSTFCDQTITTIIGQEYVIDVTSTGTSGTGIGLYVGSYGGPLLGYRWDINYSFIATATSTTVRLYRFEGHSGSGTISSVIIKEASADHSFAMANGRSSLSAFGTITKTPVATGAELVSYSGWSGSNYLQAELDWTIGTSDFTFSFWANPPASPGGYCHVISIGTESTSGQSSGGGIVLKLNAADGSAPYFYTGAGGASQSSYDANNRLAASAWNQVICGRNNGVFYIYINGELAQTGSNNSFDISDQVLMIGRGAGLNEFVPDTKLALVRISKTAPTVEQIKKSYNDEKMLFQENAKATLYGTSDSVKALAHDDDTELLHVGTSAGRSVFQGLRRIDNTTTAVAKYIRASNGMVAEE